MQSKLHVGMRTYIHNKYFNWLALNMIQRFNTRASGLIIHVTLTNVPFFDPSPKFAIRSKAVHS